MSRFLQLHVLTTYPPANLNRDDTGRPKTALMGDAQRLRVSSQSSKRSWRTSDEFKSALTNGSKGQFTPGVVLWDDAPHPHLGTRTKEAGIQIYKALIERGVKDKDAPDQQDDSAMPGVAHVMSHLTVTMSRPELEVVHGTEHGAVSARPVDVGILRRLRLAAAV